MKINSNNLAKSYFLNYLFKFYFKIIKILILKIINFKIQNIKKNVKN